MSQSFSVIGLRLQAVMILYRRALAREKYSSGAHAAKAVTQIRIVGTGLKNEMRNLFLSKDFRLDLFTGRFVLAVLSRFHLEPAR